MADSVGISKASIYHVRKRTYADGKLCTPMKMQREISLREREREKSNRFMKAFNHKKKLFFQVENSNLE